MYAPQKLPTHFKNKRILERSVYTMPGELVLAPSSNATQFVDGVYTHNVDLPAEMHGAIIDVVSLANTGLPQADPAIGDLRHWVRLKAKGIGFVRDMTKNSQLLSTLTSPDTHQWPWYDPLTLEKGQGFDVTADNNVAVGSAAGGVRLECTFHGYLLILEP